MPTPLRVLLVEDNDVFREALVLLLGLQPELDVVGSVADGAAAAPACVALGADVVLMDFRLPGMDGVEATTAVLQAAPGAAVVCLTGLASERELAALQAAGAAECLRKDEQLDEIVAAICRAADRRAPA